MVTSRQEQILSTAAMLFAERGFHGVSVHDIGAACGISGPALYRHFPGKDAILSEMLVGISRTLRSGGRARVDESTDPQDALTALIDFHIDFALKNPALIVVQEREWTNLDAASRDAVRELQLDYIDTWVMVLRGLRSDLDQRTARAAVQATFGLLNSTPHSARISSGSMETLLATMARAALLDSHGTIGP